MSKDKKTIVTVVFKDGHTERHLINASAAVIPQALVNAADTGFLCLFNNDRNVSIATDQIESVTAEPREI